jgi:hypothetical protein
MNGDNPPLPSQAFLGCTGIVLTFGGDLSIFSPENRRR